MIMLDKQWIEGVTVKTLFKLITVALVLTMVLSAATGWAQPATDSAEQHDHSGHTDGAGHDHAAHHGQAQGDSASMMQRGKGGQGSGGGMMQNREGRQEMMQQMHQRMHGGQGEAGAALAGEGAFAAIQEVVRQLEADPDTDWSQVNIDALREHFIDMHHVSLIANVNSADVEGGARYEVTGEGRTLAAIQNMVPTHASQLRNESDWSIQVEMLDDGVELTVTEGATDDGKKIRALGFSGFMVLGTHHEAHHLAIAGGRLDSNDDSIDSSSHSH